MAVFKTRLLFLPDIFVGPFLLRYDMVRSEISHRLVESIFTENGITINGPNPWDIQVRDERFFYRVLCDKNLGMGESYMDGWWDCRQIDEMICRLLKSERYDRERDLRADGLKGLLSFFTALLFNNQSRHRSRVVAEQHYDLGNNLFSAFLDPYRQYSCAYFNGTDDLPEAQLRKLDLISRKMNLQPGDKLLDIGCGWGGLAKYAAETHGCNVTAINISREQITFAKQLCRDLPVQVLECDYRTLQGSFDKIVSVGMFEHVGQKNYRTFMETVHRCLKKDGIFLLHTIGGNDSSIKVDEWFNKYIFPNGMLPSLAQIGKAIEGLFVMEDWHNLGPHYDKTLLAWNDNFQRSWPQLKGCYSERFKRMWEYYLLCCAGSFRSRAIQLWQIVFTNYHMPQPACRF